MLLKRLELQNIRSYRQAAVDFPEGSILLSGDVGSGKTTLLLATEFALFGLFRGELPATSLLRHGATKGTVTLSFSLQGKEYVVMRTLERTSQSIKQGNGRLKTPDKEESLTPVELKAKVLDIIGYPQSMVTKAKSHLFRYTVYTPQEEMKRILEEKPESRLQTLRKVFGIDQYQRIKENVTTTQKELRSETRALEQQAEELPHKEAELKQAQKAKDEAEQALKDTAKQAEQQQERYDEEAEKLKKTQAYVDKYHEQRREHTKAESAKNNHEREKRRLEQEQERLQKEHAQTKEQLGQLSDVTDEEFQNIKRQQEQLDQRLQAIREKEAHAKARKTQAQKTKTELEQLGEQCPLCRQGIPHEHKEDLLAKQAALIEKADANLEKLEGYAKQAKAKQDGLYKKEQELYQKKNKKSTLEERKKQHETRLGHIQKDLEQAEKQRKTTENTLKDVQEKLKQLQEKVKEHEQQQKAKEDEQRKLNDLKVKQARLSSQAESATKDVKRLHEELEKLKAKRKRMNDLKAKNHWLKQQFIPATDRIEQTVFASLHHEFASQFSEWFDTIIDDENLNVSLDQDFTPLIDLNGYDADLEALSGGEKTAVALAYRLALNQVVNEFIATIKTRDILILDEPTDGFSAYQLDRMRDVLDQLQLGQLFIISHEAKMETFVEHVIRVEKDGNQSLVHQQQVF